MFSFSVDTFFHFEIQFIIPQTILYAELSSVGHQPFPRHEGKRVIYWELQQSTGTSSSDQPPKIPPKRRR